MFWGGGGGTAPLRMLVSHKTVFSTRHCTFAACWYHTRRTFLLASGLQLHAGITQDGLFYSPVHLWCMLVSHKTAFSTRQWTSAASWYHTGRSFLLASGFQLQAGITQDGILYSPVHLCCMMVSHKTVFSTHQCTSTACWYRTRRYFLLANAPLLHVSFCHMRWASTLAADV